MADNIENELVELGSIARVAGGLVDFALALDKSNSIEWDGSRHVTRPNNFATFVVHHKRANNLTVTLRGKPSEFEQQSELEIKADQNGYSIFKLERSDQLGAASLYVRRAYELFNRGRGRTVKSPKTIEI